MTDQNPINQNSTTSGDADLEHALTQAQTGIDIKDPDIKQHLKRLQKLIEIAERAMDDAKDVMEYLTNKKDYRQIPGVEGKFDGYYLVTSDGQKHEVPSNYSAKSRLVYGDTLKIVQEEGKDIFKQIEKVERKNVEGVVTKKEGKWHVLTEAGSHLLLDRAVEYNSVNLNDLVEVILPADNLGAPFAAFNRVVKSEIPAVSKPIQKPIKPKETPSSKLPEKSISTVGANSVRSQTSNTVRRNTPQTFKGVRAPSGDAKSSSYNTSNNSNRSAPTVTRSNPPTNNSRPSTVRVEPRNETIKKPLLTENTLDTSGKINLDTDDLR